MPAPTPPTPADNTEHKHFRGHPASLDPEQLLKQCRIRRFKATGPGGQHRNKTESAIELIHTPTGLSVTATERRSQHDNRRIALKRLRLKLAIEHRPRPRKSEPATTSPSALWQSRIKDKRLVLSPDHADFPTLLAEALDTLEACARDHAKAAAFLGISPSQFIKLLKKEPAALAFVNQQRIQSSLRPLR